MRSLTTTVPCLFTSALCALALSACAKTTPEPKLGTGSADSTASTETVASDGDTTILISKAVRERCQIAVDPESAPTFAFDQANLRSRGKNVLDDVAVCLTQGPLKGEIVTVVGRTDPRGSEDYNKNLAANRASAARDYLTQRGVPGDQIKLMARGEQGASGTTEESYALDRRVDLELGDLSNSPILKGSMMQAETSDAKRPDPNNKAGSYADVAEGGSQVNSGSGTNSSSGSVQGSASGSVNAGSK